MARACRTCTSPHCDEINEQLVSGTVSRVEIARQWGISITALRSHYLHHLPETLALAHAADEVTHADDLLGKLDEYEHWLRSLAKAGRREKDLRLSVQAVGQLLRLTELLAKVRGELDERPVVNVISNPAFVEVRSALMVALAPYPEAKAAVGAALMQIEGTSS